MSRASCVILGALAVCASAVLASCSGGGTMVPPSGGASYSVTGSIRVADGTTDVADVNVTLLPVGRTTSARADGSFTFSGVLKGSYWLVPSKPGLAFHPPSLRVSVVDRGASGLEFAATRTGLASAPWPKFQGDVQNSGFSPYVGPRRASRRWSKYLGQSISSPAIDADGTIYVGAGDDLCALSPVDGAVKWRVTLYGWIPSTPTIGLDGRVYVTDANNTFQPGNLYAVNKADGTVIWTKESYGDKSSVPTLGPDGTLYGARTDGRVYALDPTDGSERWIFEPPVGGSETCPVLGRNGELYVASSFWNAIASASLSPAEGRTLSSDPWPPTHHCAVYRLNPADGSMMWQVNEDLYVWSSMSLDDSGTLYVPAGYLLAIDAGTGTVKWRSYPDTPVTGTAGVGAGGLYATGGDGRLLHIRPLDGTVERSLLPEGSSATAPIIDSDGTLFTGAYDGGIYAIGLDDGLVKWSWKASQYSVGGAAIAADGTLYVPTFEGALLAFEP